MFVITNRQLNPNAKGLDRFGSVPNEKGPNELRVVEAVRRRGGWDAKILKDTADAAMIRAAGIKRTRDDDGKLKPVYASEVAANLLLRRVQQRKKHLLFFVHGYNNNMKAVLDRAAGFSRLYGVEVVAFSWPADGGGVPGALRYKSDKRDARASTGALDRTLVKMHSYLAAFNKRRLDDVTAAAEKRFAGDAERRDRFISQQTARGCPFTVNMVLHSRGNYLYKAMLGSSVYLGTRLLFDNVILAAADTNNERHADWVDKIRCRRRVFITINENDGALLASRIKSGSEQLARLGHYPYRLDAEHAVYADFTAAPGVGSSHAYFEGEVVKRNRAVRRFFRHAFTGRCAECDLRYDVASGMYRV